MLTITWVLLTVTDINIYTSHSQFRYVCT